MAKGASGIGGGSGTDAVAAFDSNNWRTWQVGTKVQLSDQDFGVAEGRGRSRTILEDATITKVYDDHIVATTADGTNHWIDEDTVDIVKSASQGNQTRKKR